VTALGALTEGVEGRARGFSLADANGEVSADAAISFIVGDAKPAESVAMINATERALAAGIASARPGTRIGDISHAIGSSLYDAGYLIPGAPP
jgi:methionyl aminopeptidase